MDVQKLGTLLREGLCDFTIAKRLKYSVATVKSNRQKHYPEFKGKRAIDRNREARDYLTTGDLSRILCVAPRTVAKWCDRGLLAHVRMPSFHGSPDNHRHIDRNDAIEFIRKQGWPVPKELRAGVKLVFGFRDLEPRDGWTAYRSQFEFGAMCVTDDVEMAVVGDEYGLVVAAEAASFVLKHSSGATVVLVVGEDVTADRVASVWSGWVESRPVDVRKLLKNLEM